MFVESMINITVKLSIDLRCYRPSLKINESMSIAVPDDTTLLELLTNILQIPAQAVAIPIVNGEKCKLEQSLKKDDQVAFWPPMGGG